MIMMMMLTILSILLSIGFFTLLERKILSLSQLRLGPNKTMIMGVIQPLLDGIKLFKKLNILNLNSLNFLFIIMSYLMMLISFLLWSSFPFLFFQNKIMVMVWLLLVFGISSYCILMVGWSSLGKYSFMGSVRSMAQTLSFEVNLSLMVLCVSFMYSKLSVIITNNSCLLVVMTLIFFIMILLECQRAPMDLSEGESELVSGYNTEHGSLLFTFVFLGEYSVMMLLSGLLLIFFMKLNWMMFIMVMFIILMIRSCFPRMRYDKLMELMWLSILPFLVMIWIVLYNFKFF